jgi:hypothetical protein
MCGEAAGSLGEVGLTAGQLELLSPHTASMLTGPLAALKDLQPAQVSIRTIFLFLGSISAVKVHVKIINGIFAITLLLTSF